MHSWQPLTLALVAGTSIGFFTSQILQDSPQEQPVVASSQIIKKNSQNNPVTPPSQTLNNHNTRVYPALFNSSNIKDFSSLATAALDSSDQIDQTSFLKILIAEWAKTHPYEALEFTKQQKRSDLMFIALQEIGANESDSAITWIRDNIKDLTKHGYLMTAVFKGLAAENPQEAMSKISQLHNGPQKSRILSVALDEWAKQDIDGAFDWLETSEFSQQTPFLYDQVVDRYIIESPEKAATLIATMEEGEAKANFANNVAYQLALNDPQAAVEWMSTLSGQDRAFALDGLLESWAQQDEGRSALDYLLTISDEPNYDQLFAKVAMKLSQSSPAELEATIPTLSTEEQVVAVGQLAQVYSANTPEKAYEWIDTLVEGEVRDSAITSALQAFRNNDISKAFDLTETMFDSETKLQQMQNVMLDWVVSNQAEAEAALAASTAIPEEQKSIMLKYVYHKVKPRNDYVLPEK